MKTALACLITAVVVFIGFGLWHKSEVAQLEKQLRLATHTEQKQNNRIDDLSRNLQKHKEVWGEKEANKWIAITDETKSDLFKVYDWAYCFEDNACHSTVSFYLVIPDSLSLLEKVRTLATRLSRYRFGNLPVGVLRIDNRDGKNIAVVELREHPHAKGSWVGGYFEGSSGGYRTARTLVDTFLQRDYTKNWIDGVEFTYVGIGERSLRECDHVKLLYYTSFRNDSE